MNWPKLKVSEICDIVRGSSPRPKGDPKYYGGDVPRLMIEDITRDGKYVTPKVDYLTKAGALLSRPMKKGEVVITVSGRPGVPAILSMDACIHDGFVGFRNLSADVDTEYLYHYLSFLTEKTNNQSVGAIFKNLTTEQIKSLEISLPPITIQKRIAETLDKSDTLRKKDQILIQKYSDLVESFFYDLFGDPVANDKQWNVQKLGSLTSLISSGSTPLGGQKVYQESGILFIRSQNIRMNEIELSPATYISPEIHSNMKRTWVKNNDVLLNITGASIGRVAKYEGDSDVANVNQHVCIIRLYQDKLLPDFLTSLISFPSFQSKIIGSSSGGTRESFTFEKIKDFNIICPPYSMQVEYLKILRNIKSQNKCLANVQIESLSLFDSLLNECFS